jgi:hypothetical protein
LIKSESNYQANNQYINQYQQKVGSFLFATIISRPDSAKAATILSEFLTNPNEKHMTAIEHAISYLYNTRFLAIEYSPTTHLTFICASDAAFADNQERKSSEGYICKLYNGPIDWKSRKQKTVTTSSTEAELLSISEAGKQLFWWKRLFNAIKFDPNQKLQILCDNQQTINLLSKDNSPFKTKLKHIDIYHHWLCQEIRLNHIDI